MATVATETTTDATADATQRRRPAGLVLRAVQAVLRVAGAGLLATNAGIHAYLWDIGYRSIVPIGTLFLLDAIGASVLALAVLGTPRRWLPALAALGALLELGTVGGLILSTKYSLFGFIESTRATLYWQSAITEVAGGVALAVLAVLAWGRSRNAARTAWW